MAAIVFGKNKFEYDAELMDLQFMNRLDRDQAEKLLFAVDDLFKKADIKLYLMFGTLLGAVRDKDFIKNDYDVDVVIKDEKKLFDNLQFFKDNNLVLIRALKHKLYSFRYRGAGEKDGFIDIAILSTPINPWGLYCYSIEGFYMPKKYFMDGEIDFLGRTFNCPKEPERILEYMYSSSWRTPIAKEKTHFTYDVPSYHYYKYHILQPVKNLVKAALKGFLGSSYWKYRNKYRGHED